MQAGVLSERTAADLDELRRAGIRVMPICGSDTYGRMSEKEWSVYCRKFVSLLPPLMPRACHMVQILNEPNIAQFTGKDPDAQLALERFKIAADVIKSRYPGTILLAPGLTNENKTDKGKIAARVFLDEWMSAHADSMFFAWALHYYASNGKKYLGILKANIEMLKANSKAAVMITETGSFDEPEKWYSYIQEKGGLAGVPSEFVVWYCFNGHKGYNLVDDRLKPSSLYDTMAKDASR
jgi:hypothetical protein